MKTMGFMAVLVLPLVLAGIGGIIYIYREVMRLMSKSAVRNKVVVITDAISGLGKECSRVFHNGGARLILCGKTWEKLEALHDALISVADPSMTFSPKLILMDLEDTRAVADVVKEILDCYSCVDVLINNASVKVKGPVQTVSLEMDRKIMDSNYFGPITLTKALLPSMMSRRTGQIVLVNNIQGRIGIPFRAAFFFRKLAYGSHPMEVAEEILYTVSRRRSEVFMANPVPKVALYIRTFFPQFFFAVVAAGIKEQQGIEEDK
ncbi:dehydrogenase/reductase (SDR family) member 7Cb isoform X4 [Latimeria chalumnae]|uniref:dehydrogenase/reductase (SDR family) member 7Cb isoform X4 n=1 Tax=Latimeria chalumnae TaxID=7897 RepID=UPI0003C18B6B|nr:PREDICTED: dehydrogenase/reductase SDR family member 7C isoform X4 [Latimeria chalumnae]|eukprot:XP_006006680.1 PREDICTED: dehydrogenase/reductase SDR family member 7C isoform X4 [Latimeria chalumnae]